MCVGEKLDLLIVVDTSSSVGFDNMVKVRAFLGMVIQSLDIRPGAIRIGIINFSEFVEVEFDLGPHPLQKRKASVDLLQICSGSAAY